MLPCLKRIVFLIWIFSVHFIDDAVAITGQRLYKYVEDPSLQQVVIYPWLNPMYHTSYHPSSNRDAYGDTRPNGDRSRLFWTRLMNGFRKAKPYTINQTVNSQTLSGIEWVNNFVAAIGEEGMKQLAALVATYLSPGPAGPPGPPGSSWQLAPDGPLGSNSEKGDNGQWGGSLRPLPDISQWIKGEKGEKGERGDCSCNEIPTTLSPPTTMETTPTSSPSTPEGPTTDWPSTTEGTTTPTDTTASTLDVQTTPEMLFTTTNSPVGTTEWFVTTVDATTIEPTTAVSTTNDPTTTEATATTHEPTTTDPSTEGLTTEELTTTFAESTTDALLTSTDASTIPTDGPATITDNPIPSVTTTESSTTVDHVTSPTNEQTTSTDLITDELITDRPTSTIDWPTISTDVSFTTTDEPSITDTTEALTTSEGHTTNTEITTIPAMTTTPVVTTTANYPPVTEPIIADCSELINQQNATWQSPDSYDPEQTSNNCVLSIQLSSADDSDVQKEPICQIRLDFQKFFIAQPNRQSKCATDNFRVYNAENEIPTLCGENSGQHLYLTPRSGTAGVQLVFKFGLAAISRFWKIDITLIPCCANHILPPSDCLQYFSDFGGIVRSFNWMDSPSVNVPYNHPRQLANQNYNICFKADSLVKTICYTPCLSAGLAFSVSQNAGRSPFRAGVGVADCNDDFLLIANGYDRFNPNKRNDRFCGTIFNPDGNVTVNQGHLIGSASTTICSDIKPFQIHYTTNGNELPADVANNGFCLQYEQEYLSQKQVLLLDQKYYDLPDDK